MQVPMAVCEALRPDYELLDEQALDRMMGMVEAACAEVGVTLSRALGPAWEATTEQARPMFEKAKALVFDSLGIRYEWRERRVMVRASDDAGGWRD